MPSLVLHTIDAKSGIEHNTPLMYCPEGDGRMLVMGSNFALETHPAWTANLLAHPDAAESVGDAASRCTPPVWPTTNSTGVGLNRTRVTGL